MGCFRVCAKYFIFLLNLIFVVGGLAILAYGIILRINIKNEVDTAAVESVKGFGTFVFSIINQAPTEAYANFIIAFGCIVFAIAFFGCCGAITENTCLLMTYSTILMLLFLVKTGIGVYIGLQLKNGGAIREAYYAQFREAIDLYPTNQTVRHMMDTHQEMNLCCGAKEPEDWQWRNHSLPSSCCENRRLPCNAEMTYVFKEGCGWKLFKESLGPFQIPAYIVAGVGIVEFVASFCSCLLAKEIRNKRKYYS